MKLWRYGRTIEYIGQRYRLDGILGSGGMAEVCLAWDERTQREVALKILKSDDLDQDTLNRFMKEAAQIADWKHPHVLNIYENMQIELIDSSQGSVLFYIVMEYARGGDLQKRLTTGKPFPLSTTFALFHQLCDAVQYAHDRGVIHRDLKPLNVLFRRPTTGPEEVVLSDFGLAVQMDASHHTFARGGTLAYMAPEQFQGNALPTSDIFALGVILYQLCTGQLPFRRTIQDLRRLDPPPVPTRPSLFNPDLPIILDEPILRALREYPTERYQGAMEFWETLALALTMAAQTLPAQEQQELLWDTAGATWPFEKLSSTVAAPQVSQFISLANSLPSITRHSGKHENGGQPQAAPGTLREKQKASPGATGSRTRPAYSIPIHANSPHHSLPDVAASSHLLSTFANGSELANQDSLSEAHFRSQEVPITSQNFDQFSQDAYALHEAFLPDPAPMDASLNDLPGRPAYARQATPSSLTRSTHSLSVASRPYGDADALTPDPTSHPRRRQPALQPLQVRRKRPPRKHKLPIVPVITTMALVLLVLAILVAASVQGPLLHFFGVNATTVTLIPNSQAEQNTYALTAVTGTPDPNLRQVQARLLTTSSPTQSTTTNSTGSTVAKKATGELTFINETNVNVTIQSTVITSNSGVKVTFDGPITIPANPPTVIVTGIAVDPGAAGNIPTLDISQPCCAANAAIFVKNTAFTGGVDAVPNRVVQQKDIDRAANPLITTLTQSAQNSLQGEIQSGEHLLDSTTRCSPTVTAEPHAGTLARNVTVQVSVTCHAETYAAADALQLARSLLLAQAAHDPALNSSFMLSGQISTTVISANPDNDSTIILNIQASGTWTYHFTSTRLSQLTLLIAGKAQSDARALLLRQAGVSDVRFDSTINPLPSNTAEINLIVR